MIPFKMFAFRIYFSLSIRALIFLNSNFLFLMMDCKTFKSFLVLMVSEGNLETCHPSGTAVQIFQGFKDLELFYHFSIVKLNFCKTFWRKLVVFYIIFPGHNLS